MKPLLSALLLACLGSLASGAAQARSLAGLPALNVAALASATGRLYVGGFDQGLFVVEADGRAQRVRDVALSDHINALAWWEAGSVLWVGTARGLSRCHMTARPRCARVGSASAVHALHLRATGELWAGGDFGLQWVSPDGERCVPFGKKQGAPFRSVWALTEGEGTLFVGATNGLFWAGFAAFSAQGGAIARASVVQGNLPDDWVTALLSRGDRLYVGTYNAGVASFRASQGRLSSDGSDATLGYVNPAGLVALAGEELAVASMQGLRRGALGKTRLTPTGARDVTAIAKAHSGGYWIGTRRGLEWRAAL